MPRVRRQELNAARSCIYRDMFRQQIQGNVQKKNTGKCPDKNTGKCSDKKYREMFRQKYREMNVQPKINLKREISHETEILKDERHEFYNIV
jgi:hypothetical protein